MCNKCHDTGLLPFIGKDGKPRHDVLVDCQCKQDTIDRYSPLTPQDIDFPCSDTFRGFYMERYGSGDPAKLPPEPPERKSVEYKPRPVAKDLEQIKIDLFQLKRRSHTHDKSKSKHRYEKYQDDRIKSNQ